MINKINYLLLTTFVGCFLIFASYPSLASSSDFDRDWAEYKKSSHTHPSWDPFVEEGFRAYDRSDIRSALEFLKKTLSLGCQSPLVYFKLALIYESHKTYYSSLQHYEMARDEFNKTKSQHPYSQEFDEHYGRALYMSGDIEKAMPYLERSAKRTQSYWILRLLGQTAMKSGDLIKATSLYEQAASLTDPSNTPDDRINMYTELARGYQNQGEMASVELYYQKIIQINPDHPEAGKYFDQINKNKSQQKAFEIFERH